MGALENLAAQQQGRSRRGAGRDRPATFQEFQQARLQREGPTTETREQQLANTAKRLQELVKNDPNLSDKDREQITSSLAQATSRLSESQRERVDVKKDEEKKSQSIFDKFKSAGGRFVGSVFETLEAPTQTVIGALEAASRGDIAGVNQELTSGLATRLSDALLPGDPGTAVARALGGEDFAEQVGGTREIADIFGTRTDTGEIEITAPVLKSIHENAVGRFVLEAGGSILLDPLTYLTFGTSGMLKSGIKTAGEGVARVAAREGADEAVQSLARNAFEEAAKRGGISAGLDAASRELGTELSEDLLQSGVREVIEEAGGASQLSRSLRRGAKITKDSEDIIRDAERVVDLVSRGAGSRAQLRFGGRTAFLGERSRQGAIAKAAIGGFTRLGARRVAQRFADARIPASVTRAYTKAFKSFGDTRAVSTDEAFENVMAYRAGVEADGLQHVEEAASSLRATLIEHGREAADAQELGSLLRGTKRLDDLPEAVQPIGRALMYILDSHESRLVRHGIDPKTAKEYMRELVEPIVTNSAEVPKSAADLIKKNLLFSTEGVEEALSEAARSESRQLGLFDDANVAVDTVAPDFSKALEAVEIANPVESIIANMLRQSKKVAETELARGFLGVRNAKNPAETLAMTAADVAKKTKLEQEMIATQYKRVGDFFVHKEVADDFILGKKAFGDNESIQKFLKVYDKWLRSWKTYATSPIVFGWGFHSRNMMGNLWLSYLGGNTNPVTYARAASIQRKMAKAAKQNPALTEQEIANKALSKAEHDLWKGARDNGVIKSGMHETDLNPSIAQRQADKLAEQKHRIASIGKSRAGRVREGLRRAQARSRAASGLEPEFAVRGAPGRAGRAGTAAKAAVGRNLRGDGFVGRFGRGLGETVENNARLAHFIYETEKHGNVKQAALNTKKYLFDYDELSNFERDILKRIVPFYTFMRKNLGIHIETLAHDPSKIARADKVRNGIVESWGADPEDAPPPWVLDNMGIPVPRSIANFLGGESGSAELDLPVTAALETLRGPVQLAEGLISGDTETIAQAAREIASIPGGGPVELGKGLVELGTGRSAFTGGRGAEGRGGVLEVIARAAAPLATKGQRTTTRVTEGERGRWETIFREFLGIRLDLTTQEDVDQFIKNYQRELDGLIEELEKAGTGVPTLTDLRALELAPPVERSAGASPVGGALAQLLGR